MPRVITLFNVFVSSPADTAWERERLEKAIDRINAGVGSILDLRLQLQLWENRANEAVGNAGVEVTENDIFVGILRHRLGTPIRGGGSGTAEEIRAALQSFQQSGAPRVLLYFCSADVPVDAVEDFEQLRRLIEFKKELKEVGLPREYADVEEFGDTVEHDLTRFLADYAENAKRPTTGKKSSVFLSYERQDAEKIREIAGILATRGISTWYDTSKLTGGDDWVKRIAAAIEAADVIVLLASQPALDSKWVRRELEFADQCNKPIVPVVFDDVKWPNWFDLQFGRLQRLMFNDLGTTEAAQGILQAIRDVAGGR